MSWIPLPVPTIDAKRGNARRIRLAGLTTIAVFWLVEFIEISFVGYVDDHSNFLRALAQRIILISFGVLLTLCLVEANVFMLGQPLRKRITLALVLATVATALMSYANYLIFVILMPVYSSVRLSDLIYTIFEWSWFLFSFTGAILTITHSFEVREREIRLAEALAIAQDAQLRSLRYQLNPHFLFNTLNSIASLIRRENNSTAETMVENLSDFLRSGLELDPYDDVTLAKELELQELYLGIEMVRFPERLRVNVEVPVGLRTALIPSLITQPLVENVFKHAVSVSSSAVTLTITASIVGARLRITVANEGGDLPPRRPPGSRIGIANVEERLRVRFGDDQDVRAIGNEKGGFSALIELPLRFA